MPRGLISLKSYGLKELVEELNGLVEQIPEVSKKALQSQLEVVEAKIKINWVSMVGGSLGGYVYNSVGQSTALSKNNDTDVVGTVGVYNLDAVASQFQQVYKIGPKKGQKKTLMNAAQIAYWVEFGSARLKTGNRKTTGLEYNEEDLISISAKPFISNAFYSSLDEQQEAFKITFNKLIDETGR